MSIQLKIDGSAVHAFQAGIMPWQVIQEVYPERKNQIFAARLDGKMVDLNHPIDKDGNLDLFDFESGEGREVYWHSSAHLMAQAVKQLFPGVLVTIGPAIEEGFYYDFDLEDSFSEEDLTKIENLMLQLAKQRQPFKREEISREEAIVLFREAGETYKLELLEAIPAGETISIYRHGDFIDLCRGPHLPHTGWIKAVKMTKTSGAYWRGDEKNKMLKRIYGISFPDKDALKQYLDDIEEAKKRDHRKLGRELDLFSISEEVGPGLVLWHPNGAMMRAIVENYWKMRHFEAGYSLVNTPHIGRAELWKTSGHLGFYNESMYAPIEVEGQDYYLKPMNCPFHIEIYKSDKRSYRELPIKYAEMGTVYRYERSGTLHGLLRVRGFTQDDAHLICTPEQLNEEVGKLLDFSMSMLRAFGFREFDVYLSTMPEGHVGSDEEWNNATEALKMALEKAGMPYKIDEGGGAFYGPKIDVKVRDSLKRSWQLSTIQFDFNLPTRFDMEYVGADNQPHRPYMIHRALLGSLERFFGTLIEFHAGNFPTWLCPVQIAILPISEQYEEYGARVLEALRKAGLRAELDRRGEKIGYKIREAEMRKIPFMFIVGQKEAQMEGVSVRRHGGADLGSLSLADAVALVLNENHPGDQ